MGALAEAIRSGGWLGPYSSGDKALAALFGGPPTSSGVTVNETTALNLSAVWAAVNIISGTIASLPLILYKRLPNGGKERFTEHPVYKLLHDEPNPETTDFDFRRTLLAHILLWGNGYAEIQRDDAGRAVALWPVTPDRVDPYRDGSRALRYRVTNGTQQVTLSADEMFHVHGLGWDGVKGYSVIAKARESLGLLSATEKFGSSFFGEGTRPTGALRHPAKLSKDAQDRLVASVEARHRKLLVLEEGLEFQTMGVPPDDAQFLETRQFQTAEVARWFGIPPHKLRDLTRSTNNNIEHQGIEWVTDLMLWYIPWEKECNRKLIRPLERKQQFVEHLVEGLLRGDTASRYAAYAVARNWGWMSADDVRVRENLNPLPDGAGKIYLVPTNMAPADRLNEIIDKQVASTPPVAPPAPVDDDEPEDDEDGRRLKAIAQDVQVLIEIGRETRDKPEPPIEFPPPPDLTPIIERLDAAAQERAEAEPPAPLDITPVIERVAASATPILAGLDAMQEQIRALPIPPPPTDLTPILERLDVAEQERRALRERIADMVPSLRDVIETAVRKEVRFEANRARKEAQSPEKLRVWMESFYATREDACLQQLLPTMRLHYTLTGRVDDAEAETRRLVVAWVVDSRAALEALLATPSETLDQDVNALVTRWEAERPRAIADELMREVIADV